MKTFLAVLTLLAVALTWPAEAKKAKNPLQAQDQELRIVEVNAVSIKVTLGRSGDEHMTYKITDATKVTLNGATVAARMLRPGMMAHIEVGSDPGTAATITAKDPPTHPTDHHLG